MNKILKEVFTEYNLVKLIGQYNLPTFDSCFKKYQSLQQEFIINHGNELRESDIRELTELGFLWIQDINNVYYWDHNDNYWNNQITIGEIKLNIEATDLPKIKTYKTRLEEETQQKLSKPKKSRHNKKLKYVH
jgi:hypothetical protein